MTVDVRANRLRTPTPGREAMAWSLMLTAVITLGPACDRTVTGIDQVDAGVLAQAARISHGNAIPAERVLVDLLGRSERPDGGLLVPEMDSLFTLVLADREVDTRDWMRDAELRHRTLMAEAWKAIDARQPRTGERRLIEARALQSDVVAHALGRGGAVGYSAIVGLSLERSRGRLDATTPRRVRHMLETAFDLHEDAVEAIREGRLASAFDLAAHAAGLANTIFSWTMR